MNDTRSALAAAFRKLADSMRDVKARSAKSGHLAKHIDDYHISGGRLFVEAIDSGMFPKANTLVNRGWWDRSVGRLPGGVFTVLDNVPKELMRSGQLQLGNATINLLFNNRREAVAEAESNYVAAANAQFDPGQYWRSWFAAVNLWLTKNFPERFRPNASAWNWWQPARDEHGRLLGLNGKPLKWRLYLNGELLPPGVKLPEPEKVYSIEEQTDLLSKLTDEDMERLMEESKSWDHYSWRYDGKIASTLELADEPDRLEHRRVQADIFIESCLLLAELMDGTVGMIGNLHASMVIAVQAFPTLVDALVWFLIRFERALEMPTPELATHQTRLLGVDAQLPLPSSCVNESGEAWVKLGTNIGRDYHVAMEWCYGRAKWDGDELWRYVSAVRKGGVLGGDLRDSVLSKLEALENYAHRQSFWTHMLSNCRHLVSETPFVENLRPVISAEVKPKGAVPEHSMSPQELAAAIGSSSASLNKYAAACGVATPSKGQRNFRYGSEAIRKILQYASQRAGVKKTRDDAKTLLANCANQKEIENKSEDRK